MKIKNRSSLFKVMVGELLFFVVITVAIVGFLSIQLTYHVLVKPSDFFVTPFEDNVDHLVKGEYEKIKVEKALGHTSYFYIIDSVGESVYQSDESQPFPYTKEQLELIPRNGEEQMINYNKIQNSEKEEIEVIEHSSLDGKIFLHLVLDKDRNVLYSSNSNIKGKLAQANYQCLKGKRGEHGIIRGNFRGNDGEAYSIIFFNHLGDDDKLIQRGIIVFLALLAINILGFAIAFILYIRRINKKVTKPLGMLEGAIDNLSNEVSNEWMKYKGPKEFAHILRKFDEMSENLKESREDNKKILSDISHDLKTPISVIQLYAKLINDKMVSQQDMEKYLGIIENKSKDLGELITLFSEYSRLQRSDYQLDMVKDDMVEYTREYLIDKYDEIEDLGFKIQADLPDKQYHLKFDQLQLKRVFDNILGNAIKYNEPGRTIFFQIVKHEDEIQLNIGDNGVGIDEKMKKHIFKAFTTSNCARAENGGTGLGLAIVDKIVSLHGWTIELTSNKESGITTLFNICIPFDNNTV